MKVRTLHGKTKTVHLSYQDHLFPSYARELVPMPSDLHSLYLHSLYLHSLYYSYIVYKEKCPKNVLLMCTLSSNLSITNAQGLYSR